MTTQQAGPTTGTAPAGGLRAADSDRERTVADLRMFYEKGVLGYAEFNHRMDNAYRSTYTHELTALVADLPRSQVGSTVAPSAPAAPPRKQSTSAGKIVAIVALVIASLVGLSWLTGLITSHPIISLLAAAAIVFVVVKKPHRRPSS
ncbi:MAG: DUF1707 domain-containing protein [Streptosporangiales bacterium]|nr:DUF1707 domain-containing protein [Streptosporangiales bacterium]